MRVWVEVRQATVAEGQDVAPGEVLALAPATARLLIAQGMAVQVPEPTVAETRRRTR